jgi:hypothetical protein
MGPRVDIHEWQGPKCKLARIQNFYLFILLKKIRGLGTRVHGGLEQHGTGATVHGRRRAHRSSGECGEAERWRRRVVMLRRQRGRERAR